MSVSRNFFIGYEPVTRLGPVQALRRGQRRAGSRPSRCSRSGSGARPRPARRHLVRGRTPDARDRPRRILRRSRAHPRRADLGARRQGGGDRPAARHPRPIARPRRHLHHAQRPARAAGRRPVHDPRAMDGWRANSCGARSARTSCFGLMGGGEELATCRASSTSSSGRRRVGQEGPPASRRPRPARPTEAAPLLALPRVLAAPDLSVPRAPAIGPSSPRRPAGPRRSRGRPPGRRGR